MMAVLKEEWGLTEAAYTVFKAQVIEQKHC